MINILIKGNLLPPMRVCKSPSGNMYEDWVINGPVGSVFTANRSGWVNMKEFETFFQKVFLTYLRKQHSPGN